MATDSKGTADMSLTASGYRIELLRADNWIPWKRRMTGILKERGLLGIVDGTKKRPVPITPSVPTDDEQTAIEKWDMQDGRAINQIQLAISDPEMAYLSGADTAAEMWNHLKQAKEPKGSLAVLSKRKILYKIEMEEGANVAEHVANMRQIQDEIHTMGGDPITDDLFSDLLVMSLPESWGPFITLHYAKPVTTTSPRLTSHEIAALMIDEDSRKRALNGSSHGTALQSQSNRGKRFKSSRTDSPDAEKICHNCKKKGHIKDNCWGKGGGKEGQGPKQKKKLGSGNQVSNETNTILNAAYSIHGDHTIQADDWLGDTAASSHICPKREAFSNFEPITGGYVTGVGGKKTTVLGKEQYI
jgi:hypothetical protein